MGIWDAITDLLEAATPWTTAEAEAPVAKEEQEQDDAATTDSKKEDAPADEEEATEEEPAKEESEDSEEPEAEEEEEEEEEEDDEEEIVDPKEKFEEECKNSKQCAPAKHHFDDCVDRVTNATDAHGENCVEEFFHLAHCATACAAPKVWSALK